MTILLQPLRRFGVAALAGAGALLNLSPAAHAEKLLLLTADNQLVTIESTAPAIPLATVGITGVLAGETLVGIDTRPKDGSLVALSSGSRLYNINAATGVATAIGAGPFTPALTGTSFGFDFNPTVDRIRVVSNSRQDLRLNPDTGAVAATDGQETYAPTDVNAGVTPNVTAAAYTASGANSTSTTLYVIDTTAGVLALQNPPNNGTLTTVNPLGVAPGTPLAGYDISNLTERGYAVFAVNGVQTLYAISATAAPTPPGTPVNAATSLGALPAGPTFTGLTVTTANAVRSQGAQAFVAPGRSFTTDFVVGSPRAGSTAGAPLRVLIRGLGPSLVDANNPSDEVLQDPRLFIYGPDGARITKVDNYVPTAELTATGLTPGSTLEAAVILTLQPGSYTVQLKQKSGSEGTGRIELFELE